MQPEFDVDEKNDFARIQLSKTSYPAALRIAARIVSYIFHPLFIPVYLAWLVLRSSPYLLDAFSEWQRFTLMLMFGIMYTMFPLLSVLLMKALGFISSIHMKTRKDRIIPYVVCMIYYWWVWYVMINRAARGEVTREYVILSLAIFLASIGGMMANINMKVSMHAIAAGVMMAFVMVLGFSQGISFGVYISVAILLAGMVCTARLIDSDHTTREIYWGLFIGIGSIVLAFQVS